MSSKRLAIICLGILLLMLLVLAGVDLLRQDDEQQCVLCKSRHLTTEYRWCLWWLNGSRLGEDEWKPSIVFEDFPEVRCNHQMESVSHHVEHLWDKSLFKMSSRPVPGGLWLSWAPVAAIYANEPSFRAAVQDAIRKGTISRRSMVAWLSEDFSIQATLEEQAELRKLLENRFAK